MAVFSLQPRRMLVVSAAIGVLTLTSTVGLTPAYAEPTPTPTPAPMATPTPTSSPTPSAEATPDPTPSVDSTPDPVQTVRRAAEPAAVDPDAAADDRFTYELTATCPTSTVFPQIEITLTSHLSQNLTLYYALGGGGVVVSDSVTVPAAGSAVVNAELLFESMTFTVFFYDDPDMAGPVAGQRFTLAHCPSVHAECGTLRFFSSSEVPLTVVYGEGPADEADPDESVSFVLDPGGNAGVRIDYETLYWSARNVQPGAGDNVVIALAGEDPAVAIPQDCEPAPLSTTIVGCGGPGKSARITFNVEYGPTDTFALEVVNTSGEVVFHRTSSAAVESRGFLWYETRLPGLGHYRFNYYLNDLTIPLESSVFRVQDCVDVEGSCRSATFSSAAGNLPLEVDWSNGTDHGMFTLLPGRSRTLAFRFDVVLYRARFVSTDPRLAITAGGGRSQKVTLRCPPAGAGDGLADTGFSAGTLPWLLAGLAAVAAGTLLLLLRRRRSFS